MTLKIQTSKKPPQISQQKPQIDPRPQLQRPQAGQQAQRKRPQQPRRQPPRQPGRPQFGCRIICKTFNNSQIFPSEKKLIVNTFDILSLAEGWKTA